jgi:ABC-2 type transport system permease protein
MKLLLAELKRSWIMLRRYAAETIGGIVATTVVFYGLFLSAKYVAGGVQFGDRLDTIVVGYVLWSLVLFILGDISGGLQQEAQTGTLEQLFLSPFGAPRIFVTRALAGLTTQLLINLTILLIICLLTGTQLSFPPTLVLPLMAVLLGAYGLALAMGSLALLLKRVQQVLAVFNFGLLFVLTVPVESWAGSAKWLGLLMPMTPGAGLLRQLMAQGRSLDSWDLAIAWLNGLAYFSLGLFLFHWAEGEVKRRGRLGGY